jgi:hypothetical protein
MQTTSVEGSELGPYTCIFWSPKIGTCGEPIDKLEINFSRTRCIPNLVVGFDGERNGFTVGFFDQDIFREISFLPEELFI